ncbi:MAG: hypothetical protein EXR73_10290 [Myxococcales bacterium]|nr:hypothetical protein [Myxococcales bacterium]
MTAPLRCPHCAGTLMVAGRPRCEWCGAALPTAASAERSAGAARPVEAEGGGAAERDRLAAVLESMQSRSAAGARSGGMGCVFFVLLALVVLFVLGFLFFSVRAPTPEPMAPGNDSTPVER